MRYAALVISMFLLIQPANAAATPEIDARASLSVVGVLRAAASPRTASAW